ncbi:hypothetical protein D3C77_700310 [compost metagenome]
MFARAAGIALLITRPGLPAQPAQGALLFGRQVVPFVAGSMPELVKQTVLGAGHPSQ